MKKQKLWIRITVILILVIASAGFFFFLYTKDYYRAASHGYPVAEETGTYLVYGSRENTIGIIF